jgi:hypothetical protein
MAEWVDSAGSYFSDAELEAAVCDYQLVPPSEARHRQGWAGVDWGFVRDSSAVVVMAMAGPGDLPGDWPARTVWLPWIDEGVGVSYSSFVRRVADVADGYRLTRLASETNGVGAMPSEELRRLTRHRVTTFIEVTTTADSKQNGFGRLNVLLSQGRLALPRHPRLLAQLSALEFEERDSGTVKIEVPARAGHDDLAMALCLSVGVGDVASQPSGGRIHIPKGRMPNIRLTRPIGPTAEPGVPVVDPETRERRYAPGETIRLGKWVIPRRGYTPPGGGWR